MERLSTIAFIATVGGCAASPASNGGSGEPVANVADEGGAASAKASAGKVDRTFSEGIFRSREAPAFTVRIAPEFGYVGADSFVLKNKAAVERYHWVRATDGRVEAMIVFQFEGFLPGVLGRYRFNVPTGDGISGSNYRFSPEPVKLGDAKYVHNTWAFDNRASARDNPGAESDRTTRFLERNGYRLDDGLIMSRYVRAVGTDHRRELILFYIESLSQNDHTIDAFPDSPKPSEIYDQLSEAVVERGLRAFEVLPTKTDAP